MHPDLLIMLNVLVRELGCSEQHRGDILCQAGAGASLSFSHLHQRVLVFGVCPESRHGERIGHSGTFHLGACEVFIPPIPI